jgi:hypothetical protein
MTLKRRLVSPGEQLNRLFLHCTALHAYSTAKRSHSTMAFQALAILRMHCTMQFMMSYLVIKQKSTHWYTSYDQRLSATAKSQTFSFIQSQQQTQSMILKSPLPVSAKRLSRLCMYCWPLDAHSVIPQSHCTMALQAVATPRMHCTMQSIIANQLVSSQHVLLIFCQLFMIGQEIVDLMYSIVL